MVFFMSIYIGIKTKLFICINQRQKHIVKKNPTQNLHQ